ncbi:MAG: hypothetical protein REI96_16280 [Flavobacterium nitrogenifigens]|uniref:Uncharacterized protein n=1 Tax=Flavobacterium nitrogenifigens TaxID=1617283 RepID=A0A521BB28_9FLAO|nr:MULTISPECIES: hypothetical protein [Flavobacterium]KAF2335243.1 hypothetical protein DM397_07220 [Flavobacterium nitrogenifigens]MDQ8014012.1 hypothetical protein [Flavobacterium nitrogenifigens]WDF65256.1 hypothetical protein PQ463_03640 [Flavobacterium sp. KACC 22763]SMO44278.1 hypothetical protein SAMN06265220_101843 [Flavobacterium nitrogenifigens]
MSTIINENRLQTTFKNLDHKISKLNDQKIVAFFESLGLLERKDVPKDFLNWENILIVVPNRHVSHELKYYKYTISRISFLTNPYADQIHIFDLKDWKSASQNKTQFQIREMLKTSFGGVKKVIKES